MLLWCQGLGVYEVMPGAWMGGQASGEPACLPAGYIGFAMPVKQPSTADRGNGSPPAQAKAEEERRRKLPIKPVEGGAHEGPPLTVLWGRKGSVC